ncbi:MAG: flagellar basal-body rod protein FlgG [Planctomycetota bacterium]|jgi:flagellar basal-body rod protein FlgG
MTIRALSTAVNGMRAQQLNIDVIANNLANVNTIGYKRSRALFQDLFYQELNLVGGTTGQGVVSPVGSQVGTGARLIGIQRSFQPGSAKETQEELDVMIEGDGFFRVQLAGGQTGYTRSGSFKLDQDGNLITTNGYILSDNITVDPNRISMSISPEGQITYIMQGEQQATPAGQLNLAKFVNPGALRAIGDNLFLQTDASGDPIEDIPGNADVGLGRLRQGFLEESNVDVIRELTDMIQGQRAYDINANSIRTADEMLQVANNLRG